MSKQFWKNTALSLATVLVIYLSLIGVSIGTDLNRLNYHFEDEHQIPDNYLAQVTSVSGLRDVDPTSPYYEALRSLVERYGCSVGFADRTYRANRTIVRAEVAATTSACMNVTERLGQESVVGLKEDVDQLKRLLNEIINSLPQKKEVK
ncbi:MAG: hypothetical protein EWV92_08420 [Microcystis aeruginosa Ma_MB_S_20031200_S102]|uniref:SLH domain-containing protein n=1 Tax=Microcystis aeruginosa Ma_MB_S_20031200_S102 TaxID=2486254 RepID=A0A552EV82_MICAE|nr:MAG: hypothetical protein EWV79_17800 [Microcystis aeruginosa Ma_MB_S_20031200_S102D]TRU38387.1 MAG: hypothetical protein EWV92_08420 [Microcystis aeruginosa Ma_MB_S_20031200_S102]